MVTQQQIRELILKELPALIQNDSAFRETVLSITSVQFADKAESDNRFNHMMARLDRSMEKWDEHHKALGKLAKAFEKLEQRLDLKIEQDRQKWAENDQKWAENNQKWDENHKQMVALTSTLQSLEQRFNRLEQRFDQKVEEDRQKWDENHKQMVALTSAIQSLEQRFDQKIEQDRQKWAENQQQWAENQRQWAENQRQWAENDRKWAENNQTLAEIKTDTSKIQQHIGALGARWGIQSEASFRNALAGILKEVPGIEVQHVDEHDDEGVVFGYPEEIELDLIIKNGLLIIAEIKSVVRRSDIAIFDRKVRFYEQKQGRQTNQKIMISPAIEDNALSFAKKSGIKVYSYAQDVINV